MRCSWLDWKTLVNYCQIYQTKGIIIIIRETFTFTNICDIELVQIQDSHKTFVCVEFRLANAIHHEF